MATIDKRTTRDGQERWRVRIRRRGFCETESFSSRPMAERWAREVERAIQRGDWLSIDEPDELRLEQLIDHFLVSDERSTDTRRQLRWWRDKIGSDSVAIVSKRRILRLREAGRENCLTNSQMMLMELAPSVFLMPTSLVRRTAVKAASP